MFKLIDELSHLQTLPNVLFYYAYLKNVHIIIDIRSSNYPFYCSVYLLLSERMFFSTCYIAFKFVRNFYQFNEKRNFAQRVT